MRAGPAKKAIDVLGSLKPAIVLMSLVLCASIAGAILPQHLLPAQYAKRFGEAWGRILVSLSLNDVFHSWWFAGLSLLLLLSMAICLVRRVVTISAGTGAVDPTFPAEWYRDSQFKAYFSLPPARRPLGSDAVAAALSIPGYVTSIRKQEDGIHAAAERGRLGRYGSLLVHCGVIIIGVGALVSTLFGFTDFISIPEGAQKQVPRTDFSMRLDRFTIDYYPGTINPRQYTSYLTIVTDTGGTEQKSVSVNAPLTYEGIGMFQTDYAYVVDRIRVTAALDASPGDAVSLELSIGERKDVPELGYALLFDRFVPDFAISKEGIVSSRSKKFRNPAARVHVIPEASEGAAETEPSHLWLFALSANFHEKAARLQLSMTDYRKRRATGLKLVKDHGVPIVYVGFAMLILGTLISCYVFHRRLWVHVAFSSDRIAVRICGLTGKNRIGFRKEFRRLSLAVERRLGDRSGS